ncbi:uncharacterized protein LOC134271389 [Saccostrea cucullata]|uniref:uncharacterized protein LOC134271389 n=1 Tax=Saccostrea cuccullata TaxID=36930 RepID=UPI002ED08287
MLTFLANDQSRMDDLNKNVQTQTSSLKGKDDSLETLTEYQRQELEKTSVIINITDMFLVANSNLSATVLSLSNKTKNSLKEIGEVIGTMLHRTNSSINEIENMVETSFSQLQTSSEDIAKTVKALSNHTETSNSHVKDLIKEQSNQTKTHLENMMKELFRDFENNLIAVIESRIGGLNNSLNVTTGECVDSCWGVADGDYQSCVTCHGYVTCSNNFIYHRTCPANLIWDDSREQCDSQSKTCKPSDFK